MKWKVGNVAVVNLAHGDKQATNRPCVIVDDYQTCENKLSVLPILKATKRPLKTGEFLIKARSVEGMRSGLIADSFVCNVVCKISPSQILQIIGELSSSCMQHLAELPPGDPNDYD